METSIPDSIHCSKCGHSGRPEVKHIEKRLSSESGYQQPYVDEHLEIRCARCGALEGTAPILGTTGNPK